MNLVLLRGRQIDRQEFSCTGSQLKMILIVVQELLTNHQWFLADLSTNDGYLPPEIDSPIQPIRLDCIDKLIQYVSKVDQFLSGIFIAVPNSHEWIEMREIWDTEEILQDLGSASIEIHAFDTAYFEIYTNNSEILEKICVHFDTCCEE
jgi:hypothetical protein